MSLKLHGIQLPIKMTTKTLKKGGNTAISNKSQTMRTILVQQSACGSLGVVWLALSYIKCRHLIALNASSLFIDRLFCFPLIRTSSADIKPSHFLIRGKVICKVPAHSLKLHESLWLESETDAPTLLLSSVSCCAFGIPLELRQCFFPLS